MNISRRRSLQVVLSAAASQAVPRAVSAATAGIRLIVLDVGGTIIQDAGDVPEALQAAFARHGMTVTPDEIARWRGASKREVVRRFVEERSPADSSGRERQTAAIYTDFNSSAIGRYRDVPPIAGAETAFRQLRERGYLLASSTGFGSEITASIFQRLGWEKYFAAMITSDDVAQGRPSPFMIFHAMEKSSVNDVAEVMAVGDTPLDLQAGKNAGVRGIVGVLSGVSKRERLQPEPHTDIVASIADLPALLASNY